MASNEYPTPAWQMPIDQIDQIDQLQVLRVNYRPVASSDWPDKFFTEDSEAIVYHDEIQQQIIDSYKNLQPGDPSSCHIPPWCINFFSRGQILFSTTMCFQCKNAVVFAKEGGGLRAFQVQEPKAQLLLKLLKAECPENSKSQIIKGQPGYF